MYDYTEGASPQDIQAVRAEESRSRRRRRDSQVGSAYGDDDGAVFGGPQAALVPSSVSSFHRERPLWDRRSSNRRRSIDSRRSVDGRRSVDSRPSVDSQPSADEAALLISDEEDNADAQEPQLTRQSGMFASWTGLFRARSPESESRPALSRRTSAASQAVSDASIPAWDDAFGSEASPSPPPSPTASLPILTGGDPFFGDTRIEISPPPSLYDVDAKLPESRQNVYVADEDAHLRLTAYVRVRWRNALWYLVSVLSLGILALVGRWIPRMWLRFVAQEVSFANATFVVVEVSPY